MPKTKTQFKEVKNPIPTPVKEETGREAFERVSARRVNNIASSIHILQKMSRNSVYEYTEKDVDVMFSFLREELDKAEAAFRKDFKKGFNW